MSKVSNEQILHVINQLNVIPKAFKKQADKGIGVTEEDMDRMHQETKKIIEQYQEEVNIIFKKAVAMNKWSVVMLLIDNGIDIGLIIDSGGKTALHYAAQAGNIGVIKELLNKDAEIINSQDSRGKTALHYAAQAGDMEVARYLLDKGAQANKRTNGGKTALHYAAQAGNIGVIKELLNKDAKIINSQDSEGKTALHYAAQAGNIGVIKELLNKDAEIINSQDSRGKTALHYAAQVGNIEVARYLLDRGAQANKRTNGGIAALHTAIRCGHVEIVKLLLSHMNKDIEMEMEVLDDDGKTLLHYAAIFGQKKIAKFLLNNKQDINAKDKLDHTALYYAADNGDVKIVRLLMEKIEVSEVKDLQVLDKIINPDNPKNKNGYFMQYQYAVDKFNQDPNVANFNDVVAKLHAALVSIESNKNKKVIYENIPIEEILNVLKYMVTKVNKNSKQGNNLKEFQQQLNNLQLSLSDKEEGEDKIKVSNNKVFFKSLIKLLKNFVQGINDLYKANNKSEGESIRKLQTKLEKVIEERKNNANQARKQV